MFCRKCGASISDTGKFCPKCGTPVSSSARTPQQNVETRRTQPTQVPFGAAPTGNPYVKNKNGVSVNTITSGAVAAKKKNWKKIINSYQWGQGCPYW